MIGRELVVDAAGWRRWLYRFVGTLDVDEWTWYWHYRKSFFPHVRSLKSPRILDAGCDKGLWSFYLASKFPSCQVLGIDIRQEVISICKRAKKERAVENVEFHAEDFTQLRFKNEFDIVLSFNSLHYSYRRDVEILKRFAASLRPGGLLMLAVPAALSLAGGNPRPADIHSSKATKYGIAVDMKEFLDHYHHEELSEKLISSGFEEVEIRSVVGMAGHLAKCANMKTNRRGLYKVVTWPFAFLLAWADAAFTIGSGHFFLVLAKAKK